MIEFTTELRMPGEFKLDEYFKSLAASIGRSHPDFRCYYDNKTYSLRPKVIKYIKEQVHNKLKALETNFNIDKSYSDIELIPDSEGTLITGLDITINYYYRTKGSDTSYKSQYLLERIDKDTTIKIKEIPLQDYLVDKIVRDFMYTEAEYILKKIDGLEYRIAVDKGWLEEEKE